MIDEGFDNQWYHNIMCIYLYKGDKLQLAGYDNITILT